MELAHIIKNKGFQLKVLYLAYIFSPLHELIPSLQGKTNRRSRLKRFSPSKKSYPYGKKQDILLCFHPLDNQFGYQGSNEWLTCLTDDHISKLEKKMEDYFPTRCPKYISLPFIAETKDNEQLNIHEQHPQLQSFSSRKDQVQFVLADGILVQCVGIIS